MATNKLVIGDIHAPYHHKNTLKFLCWVRDKYECEETWCVGDELDQYTCSRYTHDPDAMSGGDEYKAAMKFWKEMYREFPSAYSVTSNHVERVAKKAVGAGIPSAYLKTVSEFMQAPSGWKWANHWDRAGIRLEHGERAGGATGLRNLVLSNMMNTVIGHQHNTPGTTYVSNGSDLLWGLNAGCLIDINSTGMAYGRLYRQKPVIGAGVIVDGVPNFIPIPSKWA